MRISIFIPLRPALLGSLLLMTASVQAQDLKNIAANAKERFTKADTDHDGKLTREEAQKGMPFVAKHFDQIDASKAGHVSLDQILHYVENYRPKSEASPKPAKDS